MARSSTEAEYIGASECVREIMWIRQLLSEIHLPPSRPTVLYQDNQSTMVLAKSRGHHERTKHIDVRFHYIKHAVEKNQVEVQYLPTEHMVADMLTKPLPAAAFEKHTRKLLGLESFTCPSNSRTRFTAVGPS